MWFQSYVPARLGDLPLGGRKLDRLHVVDGRGHALGPFLLDGIQALRPLDDFISALGVAAVVPVLTGNAEHQQRSDLTGKLTQAAAGVGVHVHLFAAFFTGKTKNILLNLRKI